MRWKVLSSLSSTALPLFIAASLASGVTSVNEERARTIIQQGMDSKNPQIRLQAVIATSMVGARKSVIDRLSTSLVDQDTQVRVAAANALADLKSHGGEAALRSALETDPVPEVAFAAAKALYALKDPEGSAALEDIYDGRKSGSSSALRKQARDFLSHFHTVRSSFLMVLNEGIGMVPIPGAGAGYSAVSELLTDPELTPRATVVLLLGRTRNQQNTDLLKRAVHDRDWSVRAAAAQTIAQGARKDLQRDLLPLLDDSREKVRFRAAGAYLRLATKN